MEVKIGLQTITWRDPQDHLMPEILSCAKKAGYQGVEIGWRRVAAVRQDRLNVLLEDHQLALTGSHAGGNLEDSSQAADERQQIDVIADGVSALGSDYLLYSGRRMQGPEDIKEQIEMLNRLAITCASKGVQLLYHNHEYEFENDQAMFDALRNETVTELGFAPDVGWIHKAGMEVIEVLESIRDRIEMIHFKDFVTRDLSQRDDTCLLGKGVVPLQEAVDWMRSLDREPMWLIAEQDFYQEGPADEAAQLNADYLRECLGAK